MTRIVEFLEQRRLFTAGAPDPFLNSVSDVDAIPGVVTDDVPRGNNQVAGIAVNDQGASFAVSTFTPKDGKPPQLMIERFGPGGALEESFGDFGRLSLRIGSRGTLARGVTIDSSGRVLVIASALVDPAGPTGERRLHGTTEVLDPVTEFHDWAIVRLETNGTLDRTFGKNGIVQLDVGTINTSSGLTKADVVTFADDQPLQIAALADGKFLVNGTAPLIESENGNNTVIAEDRRFVVARFNADGSVDKTFGDAGQAEHFAGDAMAVGPDGGIFVAGGLRILFESSGVSDSSEVDHFTSDGHKDPNFGDNGRVSFSEGNAGLSRSTPGITVLDSGAVVVGVTHLVSFKPDGTLNTDFAGDGFAPTGLGASATATKIVNAGQDVINVIGNKTQFIGNSDRQTSRIVVSALNSAGQSLQYFGTDGRTLFNNPKSISTADAVMGPEGSIYIGATNDAAVALVRVTNSEGPVALPGGLLKTFNGNTLINIDYRSLVGVDRTSLSDGDIFLRRKSDDAVRVPRFVKPVSNFDQFLVGRYRLIVGSGTKTSADPGVYDVLIRPDQVRDKDGFPAQARRIGQITIS